MQVFMAILAVALSFGFCFWLGVMAYMLAHPAPDPAPRLTAIAILVFAVAAVAFAFMAGRVWP